MISPSSARQACVLAFDVGGSHVAGGLCTPHTGSVPHIVTAPLPPHASLDDFLDLLLNLGRQLAGVLNDIDGAVLAMPGPFDYVSGVSHMQHKLGCLCGVELAPALAERFRWKPDRFRFINDAHAFLLGELSAGAVLGFNRAVGVTLGTGIGSAFARDNVLVTEGDSVPPGGEIWNLPFAGGTVEDAVSTRALQEDYASRTGKSEEVVVIAKAASTNLEAQAVFEAFGARLGAVIREYLSRFSPEVVVLGGGISRSASLFLPSAERVLEGRGFRLITSSLMQGAALVGGAVYWLQSERASIRQKCAAPLGHL